MMSVAARKWWTFLDDNFDAERYLTRGSEDDVFFQDPTAEEAEALIAKMRANNG